MKNLKWEQIDHNIQRTRIFGGWLVKCSSNVLTYIEQQFSLASRSGYEWRESITFVPDPYGEWIIK